MTKSWYLPPAAAVPKLGAAAPWGAARLCQRSRQSMFKLLQLLFYPKKIIAQMLAMMILTHNLVEFSSSGWEDFLLVFILKFRRHQRILKNHFSFIREP